MLDAQLSGSILKKGLDIPFAVGKAVGKLKAIVCLDTFDGIRKFLDHVL